MSAFRLVWNQNGVPDKLSIGQLLITILQMHWLRKRVHVNLLMCSLSSSWKANGKQKQYNIEIDFMFDVWLYIKLRIIAQTHVHKVYVCVCVCVDGFMYPMHMFVCLWLCVNKLRHCNLSVIRMHHLHISIHLSLICARFHIDENMCVITKPMQSFLRGTLWSNERMFLSTCVSALGYFFSWVTLSVNVYSGYCEAEREMTVCRNPVKEGI